MKRKKIVAVLLTAALTATSFLPGTGFSGLEKAYAGAKALEFGKTIITDNIMENDLATVATTTDASLTYDELCKKLEFDYDKNFLDVQYSSDLNAEKKAEIQVKAKKYGDYNVKITNVKITSGGSTSVTTGSAATLSFTVQTKAVSLVPGSIIGDKVLTADFGYVEQNNTTAVDAKYVSPSTISYKWYTSDTKTTDISKATLIPTATEGKYTVTDSKAKYYIVQVENSGIDGTKTVRMVTDGKIAGPSGSSSSSVTVAGASNTTKTDTKKDNTATTDKKDDTNKTTTTVEKADGSKETTTVEENADGSKVEKVVTENPDGSVTEKIKEVRADGSTFESEKTTKADGSSVEKSVETKADGTTITTEKTTKANGDVTSKVVTKYVSGKTVTEESDIKANGNYVITKTTVKKSGAASLIVSKKTGKNEVAVTYSAAKNSKKLTVNKIESNAKTVTLPATVKAAGTTYKVTAVKAGAMKNNKVVTKATLGKNITSLGKNACMGASNLKTVNIKGNVTTYGKNCLKNINKKAVVNFTVITKKQAKASAAKLVKTSGIPAGATLKYKNKVIK